MFLLVTVVDCDIWLQMGMRDTFRKAWTKLFNHCKTFAENSESRTCNSMVWISVWLLEYTHLNIAKIIA